jgi:hypothetical protein
MMSPVLSPPWLWEPATVFPDALGLLESVPDGSPTGELRLGIVLDAAVEDVLVELDGLESVPDGGPAAREVLLGFVLDAVVEDVLGEFGELESVSD